MPRGRFGRIYTLEREDGRQWVTLYQGELSAGAAFTLAEQSPHQTVRLRRGRDKVIAVWVDHKRIDWDRWKHERHFTKTSRRVKKSFGQFPLTVPAVVVSLSAAEEAAHFARVEADREARIAKLRKPDYIEPTRPVYKGRKPGGVEIELQVVWDGR
jgi:hypothetical protein